MLHTMFDLNDNKALESNIGIIYSGSRSNSGREREREIERERVKLIGKREYVQENKKIIREV